MRTELCLFAANTEDDLLRDIARLSRFLDHARDASLQDVAFTLGLAWQEKGGCHRLAVVAESIADLRAKLTVATTKIQAKTARIQDRGGTYYQRATEPPGKVAFLFPGEFAAHPEMTRDLCLAHPFCREPFDDADEASRAISKPFPLGAWIFPPAAPARAGGHLQNLPASILASHAANTLFARLFDRLGIRADAAAGISSGEITAFEYAGAFDVPARGQRVDFLRELGDVLTEIDTRQDLAPRHLVALENPSAELLAELEGEASMLLATRAGHHILSIPSARVPGVKALLARHPGVSRNIPFSCAFHTPDFEPAANLIRGFTDRWLSRAPKLPLYSFATAAPFPADLDAMRETAACQWLKPLLFDETINRMHDDGFRVFIELGVRGNLTPLATAQLKGRSHVAVAVNRIHRADIPQLHHALALLAVNAVPLRPEALHLDRGSRELHFDRPPSFAAAPLPVELHSTLSNLGALPPPPGWFGSAGLQPGNDAAAFQQDDKAARNQNQHPLLENARLQTNANSITATIPLALDKLPFLRDESFGTTRVSAVNASLRGYTVLNLPAALELMAETASRLAPGKSLFQALNLRALQWIGFDYNDITLSITATPAEYADKRFSAFDVRLQAVSPVGSTPYANTPTISATLLFAPVLPPPADLPAKPLTNPIAVNWSGTDIYPDRLPAGPLTRSVVHVGLLAEDGVDYEVTTPEPAFLAHPLLVSALGDGLTLWQAAEKFNGHIPLPFRVQSITFLASRIPPGLRLRAHLRITGVTPRSRTATITLHDPCGRVLIRATGWEALRCEVSPKIHRFVLRSSENYLTHELPRDLFPDLPVPLSLSAATGFPSNLFTDNQGLWLRVLAFVLLSPPEREEWLGMRALPARRVEWLLGRAAAKEATRRLLLQHYQQHYNAPDIPIWASDTGKPAPYGPWQTTIPATLDLSIAHTPGLILAAAVPGARIGIDVENASRDLTETFTRGAFIQEEHELAAASGDGPGAILRFWCAKEAFTKALGTGIRYAASDLRIREYDPSTGRILIEAVSQWAQSLVEVQNKQFPVQTALWQSHILAVCILPLPEN